MGRLAGLDADSACGALLLARDDEIPQLVEAGVHCGHNRVLRPVCGYGVRRVCDDKSGRRKHYVGLVAVAHAADADDCRHADCGVGAGGSADGRDPFAGLLDEPYAQNK